MTRKITNGTRMRAGSWLRVSLPGQFLRLNRQPMAHGRAPERLLSQFAGRGGYMRLLICNRSVNRPPCGGRVHESFTAAHCGGRLCGYGAEGLNSS